MEEKEEGEKQTAEQVMTEEGGEQEMPEQRRSERNRTQTKFFSDQLYGKLIKTFSYLVNNLKAVFFLQVFQCSSNNSLDIAEN